MISILPYVEAELWIPIPDTDLTLEIKLYLDLTIVKPGAGFKLLAVLQYYTERFIHNYKSVILENSVY